MLSSRSMSARFTARRRAWSISSLKAFVAVGLFASVAFSADTIPAERPDGPVALVGADIYPVGRPPIPGGTIIFDQGKIVSLGRGVAIPANATRVEAGGRRVYPVLIACGTQLGLVEIGAVRATRDQSEVGEINPNVRAEVSVNPDSELLPVTRSNGVALVQTMPTGGLISGSSALIQLDGWTWEDMTVEAPLGIHVQWPEMITVVPGDSKKTEERRKARDEKLRKIELAFERARAYMQAASAKPGPATDLRSEALLPVVRGERPVFLHANAWRDIEAAVQWALGEKLKPIVVGGRDAPRLTSLLSENDIPVIYGPVHSLPRRRGDDYDAPFRGPLELQRAGVKFAIASFETSNARNLPYQAATAAAYGLDPQLALRAVTLSAAEILGVADRVGSLEAGKVASLMITDGDPLEITTNVHALWLDGRPVDLSNRQTRLHDKYVERIRRAQPVPRPEAETRKEREKF